MENSTKYNENLILDNMNSVVLEDNSDKNYVIENFKSGLKTRNLIPIDSSNQVLEEENIFKTDENYIPNLSMPVFFNKKPDYPKNYFTISQTWLGHVLEIKDDVFISKLEDLNQPGTYEIGEFENTEVSQEDLELFKKGSAFYWSIGLANSKGQAVKQSFLRFQRINDWTESDYDSCADRASDLLKNLNWSTE